MQGNCMVFKVQGVYFMKDRLLGVQILVEKVGVSLWYSRGVCCVGQIRVGLKVLGKLQIIFWRLLVVSDMGVQWGFGCWGCREVFEVVSYVRVLVFILIGLLKDQGQVEVVRWQRNQVLDVVGLYFIDFFYVYIIGVYVRRLREFRFFCIVFLVLIEKVLYRICKGEVFTVCVWLRRRVYLELRGDN